MNWFYWMLVALLALNVIVVILNVDKPRQPITPGGAVWILLVNGLLILGILHFEGVWT